MKLAEKSSKLWVWFLSALKGARGWNRIVLSRGRLTPIILEVIASITWWSEWVYLNMTLQYLWALPLEHLFPFFHHFAHMAQVLVAYIFSFFPAIELRCSLFQFFRLLGFLCFWRWSSSRTMLRLHHIQNRSNFTASLTLLLSSTFKEHGGFLMN